MKTTSRRPPLSRERILRAALGIVDEEGLEAISMRRLGQALGVEAMSLYNHVSNKAELLDGVFEAILGELPAAKREPSWQAFLRERARARRSVLRAHPNALPLFATRPAVTPASIAHVEAVLEALRGGGFGIDESLGAPQVLVAFVVGHTVATSATPKPDEASAPAYHRLDPAAFPRVREAAASLASHDVEAEFAFSLAALVAGLEAGRKRRAPTRR